ncbi:MAG: ShlB/FhaC/HecB family hemolysin secretion/activation protein [Methylophilaceae bacterium]
MNFIIRLLFPLLLGATFSVLAAAPVTPTDAGRVLQDNQAPGSPNTPLPPPIQAPQTPKQAVPAGAAQDVRVNVSEFAFSGNSVISTEALQAAVAEFTNRELNFGELLQVTDKIETLYHQAGYFLAQATLPPQQIRDGVISIAVTEGKLGKVRLEGESRVKPEVLYHYLDRLPTGEVIIESQLDRQALLASELAGAEIKLDLQAGDDPGTTDVVLVQQATPLFTGRIGLDNYGLPATGENRLSVSAALNSPFHLGDRLSANFIVSDDRNLHTYGLRYELPIGGDGWRVSLAKTRAVYSLGGAFSALNASGTADSWRAGVSYPWLRSRSANINLQLEADLNNLEDNLGAAGLDLKKRSYGFTFSPSADWSDKLWGGGNNQFAAEMRAGRVNLGAVARTLDVAPAGPDTDGVFGKLTFNLSRRQAITNTIALSGHWKQQFATTNLESSEKISVGGAQTLMAYPSSQATGDEGGIGKLELRWQARDNLSLGAFVEYAHLKLLHNPIAGSTTNHANFRDVGFALNWAVHPKVDFAASVAWAGGQPPNPADNDRPRIWGNLGYHW